MAAPVLAHLVRLQNTFLPRMLVHKDGMVERVYPQEFNEQVSECTRMLADIQESILTK